MIRHLGLALGCALLVGCATSLQTGPDTLRSAPNQALPGISYALPMVQYDVSVSYKLQRCPGDYDSNKDLLIKVETTATSAYVPGERYLIDYRSLSSKLKITDFTIETYADSGTLKGINASADDKSADVLKSVTETFISGASILSGSPFAAAQSDDPVQKRINELVQASITPTYVAVCTSETLQAVQTREAALTRIKSIGETLRTNARRAEQIGVRASLKLLASDDAAQLLKLHNEQDVLADELAALQATVDKADGKFTFADRWVWPATPVYAPGAQPVTPQVRAWAEELFELESGPNAPDPIKLAEAFKALPDRTEEDLRVRAGVALILRDLRPVCADDDLAACLANHIGIYASLETGQMQPHPCTPPTAGSKDYKEDYAACPVVVANDTTADPGIFLREPIKARLILCGEWKPCIGTATKPLYEGQLINAPQLGQLRFAELTNGNFQNNALVVVLNRDGTIEKLQYQEKAAVAAAALASISASAGKADAYLAKRRDNREAEEKAEIADARAEIAYQRSEAAYLRTESAAVRTEAAAIRTDDVSKLQAQIDILSKQKALNDLIAPPDPVVAKDFADENLRLKAELERLSTQVAIKDALLKLGK